MPSLPGAALPNDPGRNKRAAFTAQERREHGLEGLLRTRWKRLAGSSSVPWASRTSSRTTFRAATA